ncbi:MAG: amidohydrolase family protein [Oscillospiraceae bacterium]|nr:amidohydrolase family protein [Oscillospiraceae bacterium]
MIIHSNKIYMEDGCKAGYLEIEGGIVKHFYPGDATHKADGSPLKADADYGSNRVIPGIFDTHNHGGFGVRIGEGATEDEVKLYLKGSAANGVTALFPTTTEPGAMAMLAKMAYGVSDGAKIMGIHSEGPWGARVGEKGINTGYPKVDMGVARQMVEACNGKLMLVGIAPEVENAFEAIDYFLSQGIVMAMYHTNANYEQANRGVDRGITVATHLGNVMTGMHHRDVGVMGTSILRDEVYCELICDYLHICQQMVEIVLRLKDHEKVMMISDSGSYAGCPTGKYRSMWGNARPDQRNSGAARADQRNSGAAKSDRHTITITEEGYVLSETGRLSGSSKPVMFGIKNLVERSGMPLEDVWPLSSYNVFKKYGFADKKGSIKTGKDADFVVISDAFDVLYTYSEGRLVYDHNVDKDIFNHNFVAENKLD